jgi:hypothetical protein
VGSAAALKNFVLRGGQVSAAELSSANQGVKGLSSKSRREIDVEWSDGNNDRPVVIRGKQRSQLDGLTFDDCEPPQQSKRHLQSNFIDAASDSDEGSDYAASRTATIVNKSKLSRTRKRKKTSKKSKTISKVRLPTTDSDSSNRDAAILRSSSDSDVHISKPSRKASKNSVESVDVGGVAGTEDLDDAKVRKTREAVGLSEQQVVQYANMNLVPFQMTAAQCQSVRQEQFQVDGKLMSEDEIKTLILSDVNVYSKNLDAKFLSFIRQHIMVDVFKDVYFISNVIQFYRMKRFLHSTQPGDHIVCVWQVVLKQVAMDLVEELVASNKLILEKMDANLLELKKIRRQMRHEENLVIGSDKEKEQIALDLKDLMEYKEQMKLSKEALEAVEKIMKKRIHSFAHTTGAKMICIWAKLNGFQHLLTGQMSKFEKKFLMDVTMPFYSVLSNDLGRRWSANSIAVSPNGLFPGIDLSGSNNDNNSPHQRPDPRNPYVSFENVGDGEDAGNDLAVMQDVELRSSDNIVSSERNTVGPHHSLFGVNSDSVVQMTAKSNGGSETGPQLSRFGRENLSGTHHVSGKISNDPVDSVLSQKHLHQTSVAAANVAADLIQEEDTDPQELVDQEDMMSDKCAFHSSFSSPYLDTDRGLTSTEPCSQVPSRPVKDLNYTSAMLSASPDSNNSHDNYEECLTSARIARKGPLEFLTPSVGVSSKQQEVSSRKAGMFSISSHIGGNTMSYLSSVSSANSMSSDEPIAMCESNAAVLFDQMKTMSQDTRTVNSMLRFIDVMNEKPPSVIMPATKDEEDKILSKAKAKKKKEEAKAAAVAQSVKKTADLVATSALPSDINFSSEDDLEMNISCGLNGLGVRQKTDSYSIFQKLFVFICKKHVDVKDAGISLQFFGQRLTRTMSNSALLKFILLLLRNKEKDLSVLVVYLLDEKQVCSELKCVFGISYKVGDYFNILGDGYCVLRCMFALFFNEASGYKMSAADMKAADIALFQASKSRQQFYNFLNSTRDSIDAHCNDEVIKASDKRKLRTLMVLFAAFPQLKQIPGTYWACLDWLAYAPFNCTAFSTNYSDCVPGYAQLHCSSTVRRDMSSATGLAPYSVDEVSRILTEPLKPNFCVLEGQHAFVVDSPPKETAIHSFKSVLGLFLGVCLKSIADLSAVHSGDLPLVEEIINKMVIDNDYSLNEIEANTMSSIVRFIEQQQQISVSPETVVLCSENYVPPISPEAFRSLRPVDDGKVIDLCDSDTGDVDRVKRRVAKARLARQDQELVELNFKV